ncbi:MAG TPA: hypothetical protein VLH08_12990 [Acidobacteriota bacterium]|nr:hypothetical protein [Acidobacteriota bacterium]
MRIIVGSAGARSDLTFLFALAHELQKRHHVVTLVAPEKYRSEIMKIEVRMVTCGRSFEEYLEGNPGEHNNDLAKGLASHVASQFVSLRDALREADVFVAGTFLIPAASMAEKVDLPFFQVIQSPLLLDADQFPAQGIPKEKVSGLLAGRRRSSIREDWENTIGTILNSERKFSHLGPTTNLYKQLFDSGRQLVCVDQEFAQIEQTPKRSVVGYFNYEPLFEQQLPELLNNKPSIFVGPLQINQIEREPFLQALAASLPEYQLIVRADWLGTQEKQLFESCYAIDQALEPAGMLQSAAVVHQGAAGFVMMCARAGVPQVITPFLVDHYFWADRVRALKLGPDPVEKIEAKSIAAAVQQAIQMRDSVASFAEQNRSRNGIAEACDVIESAGP